MISDDSGKGQTQTTYDLVIVRAKLELPVPEGVTEWRFTTFREGDKVTFGRIEVVAADTPLDPSPS